MWESLGCVSPEETETQKKHCFSFIETLLKTLNSLLKTVNECFSGLFFTESKSKSFSPAVNKLYNQSLYNIF